MEALMSQTFTPVTCTGIPSPCALLSRRFNLTQTNWHNPTPLLAQSQKRPAGGRRREGFSLVYCQASEPTKVSTEGSEGSSPVDVTADGPSAAPKPVTMVPEAEGFRSGGKKPRRTADSTDWIASSLTRRFGIAGGLVWAGILAFGAISEQLKTRREVFEAEQGTVEVSEQREVARANGVRYTDFKVGGGQAPLRGDLVLVSVTGRVLGSDAAFFDGSKRPIAFILGGRSLPTGICQGIVEELFLMKAGGKRRVIVPPELGYGSEGTVFADGARVPGDSVLDYVVELQRVSIPPT